MRLIPAIPKTQAVVKNMSLISKSFCAEGSSASFDLISVAPVEKEYHYRYWRSVIENLLKGSTSLNTIKKTISQLNRLGIIDTVPHIGLKGGADYDSSDVEFSTSDEASDNETAELDEEAGPSSEITSSVTEDIDSLDLASIEETEIEEDVNSLVRDYTTTSKYIDDVTNGACIALTASVISLVDNKEIKELDEDKIFEATKAVSDTKCSEFRKEWKAAKEEFDAFKLEAEKLPEPQKKEAQKQILALTTRLNEIDKTAKRYKLVSESITANKDQLMASEAMAKALEITKQEKPMFNKAEVNRILREFDPLTMRNQLYMASVFGTYEEEAKEKTGLLQVDMNALYSYLCENAKDLKDKDLTDILIHARDSQLKEICSKDVILKRYDVEVKDGNIHIKRKADVKPDYKSVASYRNNRGKSADTPKLELVQPALLKNAIQALYANIDSTSKRIREEREAAKNAKSGKKVEDRYGFYNRAQSALREGTVLKEKPSTSVERKINTQVNFSVARAADKIEKLVKEGILSKPEKPTLTDKLIQSSKEGRKELNTKVLAKLNEDRVDKSKPLNKTEAKETLAMAIAQIRNNSKEKLSDKVNNPPQNARNAKDNKVNRMATISRVGTVPTTRAEVSSGNKKSKFIKKEGLHSVYVNGVIELEMDPSYTTGGQNAFTWAYRRVFDSRESVQWNRHSLDWEVNTPVRTPFVHGDIKTKNYRCAWERFTVAAGMPEKTLISYTSPQVKDRVESESAAEYIKQSGMVNNRAVSDSLIPALEIQKHVAEAIAYKITENLVRYNNKALFTQGVMLAAMLLDLETANVRYVYREEGANTVLPINTTPQPGQIANLIHQMDMANSLGAFVFQRRYVSDADITIMHLLSRGMGAINVEGEVMHVFQSFEFGKTRFAVIGKGFENTVPLVNINSAQVWAFLKKLARNQNMTTDFVEGVVNATRIMNGVIKDQSRKTVFITCTLESSRISLPKPHAHNFMWRIISSEPREVANEHLRADYRELDAMSLDQFMLCSTLLSTMISMGVSTILNRYNLTGRELNELHTADIQCPAAHALLRNLFDNCDGGDRSAIFVYALSCVTQMSGCVFNSSSFINSPWCDGMRWTGRLLTRNELWAYIWPNRVPYICNPLVIGPYITGMPSIWGLSRPGMSFEIKQECVVRGANGSRAWYVSMGEDKYDKVIESRRPYIFVSYGSTAMNFVLQHTPFRAQELRLCYELRRAAGTKVMTTDIALDLDQPDFDDVIPHITPGTLLTYDHRTESQLVPVLYADEMPQNLFGMLSSTNTLKSDYAGVEFEHMCTALPNNDATALGDEFSSMGMFNKDPTPRSASEN